jgi:hypothetical protein
VVSVTLVQASSAERHLESASSRSMPQTYRPAGMVAYRSGKVGANVGGRLVKPTHSLSGIAKHIVSVGQPSPRGHSVLRMQLATASL